MPLTIRPMTAADVDAATETVLRGEWGDRRLFFGWAAGEPRAFPFVAERGGEIFGTAVGSAHGSAGWVGAVFVDAAVRGSGVGRALTDAVIEALESAGCRTLILVATSAGRPLYEKIGFRLDTTYHTLEAPGMVPEVAGTGIGRSLEPWRPDDLPSMARLDAAATGEDRAHLLAAFATPESARVVRDGTGAVRGFVVRAPWGGGATVAPDPDVAIGILQGRRMAAGPDRTVRAGILAPNRGVLDRLRALGWTEAWQAPRLRRGEPLDWEPTALWGQFNHALG
jgi:GNAT superfamily N-acetyltransferase